MKGIIFNELVEFANRELPETARQLGDVAYSPLANYPDDELLALVARLSEAAGVPAPEILRRLGSHLFRSFATLYPVFLDGVESAFDLLGGIETYVHGEVRKLYPDAEFPRFEVQPRGGGRLEMVYRSRRPLADLADGMIRGCVAWFGDPIDVDRQDLDGADGHAARFTLRSARVRPPRRGASE
jgi:Haem-NO-binding